MKVWIFSLLLIFTISVNAQFEYNAFNSYGVLTDLFQYDGKIYGVPIGAGTIVEIDKVTEEVKEYNIYNGFPMRDPRNIQQIDSFLVVINHDGRVEDFRGFLSFNMNSKEVTLLSNESALPHYRSGDNKIVFYRDYAKDEHTVYTALRNGIFEKYAVMSYNPITGLDSLDLSPLPREPGEEIMKLRKSGSKFCGYTTLDRFIIWEESNPADHIVIDYSDQDYVYFRGGYEDQFYFSAGTTVDSLYKMSHEGEISNFSAEYDIPSLGVNDLQFVDDLICVTFANKQVRLIDKTTGVHKVIDQSSHDLPYNPYRGLIDEEDHGVWVSTSNSRLDEYKKILHHISIDNVKKEYETNPNYHVSYGGWYTPWIKKNNEFVFLRLLSYYIYDGKEYHQYPINHPWFTQANMDEVDNFYPLSRFEDDLGNVYCSYGYNYSAWKDKEDTTFYMRINADHSHEFMDKKIFDKIVQQQVLTLGNYHYELNEGELKILTQDFEPLDITIDDSLTHLHGCGNRLLLTSVESVYLMDAVTHEYAVIQSGMSAYPPYKLTNDRFGNLYYYKSGLKKVPHYSDSVVAIDAPDTVYMHGATLQHDWNGNIFGTRTGKENIFPHRNYGYIIHHNGFYWDLSNKILTNLTYRPAYYDLVSNALATKHFLYTYHSSVEIGCPAREIDEIQDVYTIHDSTDYISINLGSDFTDVEWDNQSNAHARLLNEPGDYWVRAMNSQGCIAVKEFKVILEPTANFENNTIFYYSESNHHPLVLPNDLKGDLFIYDLKGALIKQFDDYQNDWVPEANMKHGMVLFAIYNGDELVQSGRIFFL